MHPQRRGTPGRHDVTLPPVARWPVATVLLVLAGLLTALSARYGFHRDEFYFLAAGERLDWGYVDQPPLTPLLAELGVTLFGHTLPGLRVVATIIAVASTWVVVLIARELGGRRDAQLLAAVCAAGSSLVLTAGHAVLTVTFDMLAWLLVAWLVLRLLRTGEPRWYLAIGAAVGLGLQNKYLVLLLVAALFVGVLLTGPRRVLLSWWLLAGAAVAALIYLPNLLWQAANGWPQFTIAQEIELVEGMSNRAQLLPLQLVYLSPLFVPIWVAALVRPWREPDVRWARALSLAYPVLLVLTLIVGGKPYYPVPLLAAVMGMGAEPVLRWARARWRRAVLVGGVAVGVVINIGLTLPALPPAAIAGIHNINPNQGEQIGWPNLLDAVEKGWSQVPENQRSRAVVFTEAYGEAGAVDWLGQERGLPRAYSGHMGYGDFGPPPDSLDGPIVLVKNRPFIAGARYFQDCRQVATVDNQVDVPSYGQGATVSVCSGLSIPWSRAWPELRHYYLTTPLPDHG